MIYVEFPNTLFKSPAAEYVDVGVTSDVAFYTRSALGTRGDLKFKIKN